jgi:hypothetical protein
MNVRQEDAGGSDDFHWQISRFDPWASLRSKWAAGKAVRAGLALEAESDTLSAFFRMLRG